MTEIQTTKIRELNDLTRKFCGLPIVPHRLMVTQGIAELGDVARLAIIEAVRTFDDFSEDNDPYQEHDFGAFTYQGQKIFWKIDYYDKSLERGSEDPADSSQTMRVLTVMLASEY